jgi:hypothetical protein
LTVAGMEDARARRAALKPSGDSYVVLVLFLT